MSLTPAQTALWANQVQRDCLIEAGDDVEAGLAAAEFILSNQSSPDDTTFLDIALGNFDPNQPRRPKGDPEGGEWVTVGGYAHPSGQMHVGGFHAKVTKDGTIVSGKLKGRKIQDVKKHFDALPDEHKSKFTDGLHDSLQSLKPQSVPHTDRLKAEALLNTLPKFSDEEKKKAYIRADRTHLKPPGGIVDSPWSEDERSAFVSAARQGTIPVKKETLDPSEFVYSQEGGLNDSKIRSYIRSGPPRKQLGFDRSIAPVAVRHGGKLYLIEGNHRAVWSQAYGEPMDVLVVDEGSTAQLSLDVVLSHDIHNRTAQGILNRSLQAAKGLSASARRDLTAAIKADSGEAILTFIDKYRLQLARLLTTTQLAAVLEGAREVADKVPTLATFPGAVPPPPTLEPQQAVALVERLERTRDAVKRADIIADLPPEQQEYARQAVIAKEAYSGLPPPSFAPPAPPAGSGAPEDVHLPTIDNAVKSLAERNVMDRQRYDALDAAARAKAFTVANISAQETLAKIRDSLAENVRQGVDYETWKGQVLQDVDSGTFMSDSHQETVFRTNIQSALSDGQQAVLNHPLVRSGFPYSAYDAIHDDRARENHLALEKLGIGGTNIYRNDDPVFQLFRPPWDYNDRCGSTPMTVRQAAEAGVQEAVEWLRTGVEPAQKAFVEMPPFQPPPGFQRTVSSAPLSIQLSMQPMASFGFDPNEKRDEDGKWTKNGGINTPNSRKDAEDLALLLRDGLEKVIGDPKKTTKGKCYSAVNALGHILPNAQSWSGMYDLDEEAGDHYISKVGNYFIDVTADQFGGPKIVVFMADEDGRPDESDDEGYKYRGFSQDDPLSKTGSGLIGSAAKIVSYLQNKSVSLSIDPDDHPRNTSNQFIDKYTLAEAASDPAETTVLRESVPEDQHPKLDRAIAHLQSGGTVNHPSEPPGLGIDIHGDIPDPRWANYAHNLVKYQEWSDRDEERKTRRKCVEKAVKLVRKGNEVTHLDEVDTLLTEAGATAAEMRILSRMRHRTRFEDGPRETLYDLYEDVIEAIYRRIETDVDADPEPVEPEEPAANVSLSTDAEGHQHKGKGTGGGQFTSSGGDLKSLVEVYQNMPPDLAASLVKNQVLEANQMRKRKGLPPVEFELKLLPLDAITPSQTGEDYINDSSKYTSKHIKKFDADERREDYSPAAVDENLKITDGNHRHAARKLAGVAMIPVLVPVGTKIALSVNDEIPRDQLIAEILVILFGDEAEEWAKSITEDTDVALAVGNPKVKRRYGKKPGPQWTSGGMSSRGVQIWLWGTGPPRAATPAPTPPAPTPAPSPNPYGAGGFRSTPAPAPVTPPVAPPAPTPAAPGAPLRAGGQRARQASITAFGNAMAVLNAGQALTVADKATLSTKLTNMPTPMLRSLHTALGGAGAVGSAKATVAAVKAILAGAAAAPTPAAPTPAAPTPTPTPAAPPTPPSTPKYSTGYKDFDDAVNDVLAGKTATHAVIQTAGNVAGVSVPNREIVRAINDLGGTVNNPNSSRSLKLDLIAALTAASSNNASAQQAAPTPAQTSPQLQLSSIFSSISALPLSAQGDTISVARKLIAGTPITQTDFNSLRTAFAYNSFDISTAQKLASALGLPNSGNPFSDITSLARAAIQANQAPVTPPPVPTPNPIPTTPATPTPLPKWATRKPLGAGSVPPPIPTTAGGPPYPQPGPPPRLGLVWNPTTGRWTRPGVYEPPAPKLGGVGPYVDPSTGVSVDSNGAQAGLPDKIDGKLVGGFTSGSLPTDFTSAAVGTGSVIIGNYKHGPSGYTIMASWRSGPPAAGQPSRYNLYVMDGTGAVVSTYDSNANRDAAYIEGRATQVAHWLEGELDRIAKQKSSTTIKAPLAQFAHEYAQPGVVPFKIGDSDWGDAGNRKAVEGFLKGTFPKLVGAQQHAPHGRMDTVEHTMNILNPLNLRTAGLSARDAEILRLGMTFHDVGKQYDPKDHDHPRKSATDAEPLLWQFGLSDREVHDTLAVIKWHDAYGDAIKAGGGAAQASTVAKIAYEYTDDTLAPDARKKEALRINNLLMRAWQSDLSSIPGLTADPIPGRPDISVWGSIHVDTAGPAFEAKVAAVMDAITSSNQPKSAALPKKPATPTVGSTPPYLVADGCEWGELVQRTDNLPVGQPTPYGSTVTPPKEVYDEAHKHPDLNFARAFNMGYDGPTGKIITVYHGIDSGRNTQKKVKDIAASILSTGAHAGKSGDNVFGNGIYAFLNGADGMPTTYNGKGLVTMELHTGRMVDIDELRNTVMPQWEAANKKLAKDLRYTTVYAKETAAALWAGYSSISLKYHGGEPAVVILDPSRLRPKGAVSGKSDGYRGLKLKTTNAGTVTSKDLTADEKDTPTGHSGHVPTSHGIPKGWSGQPRTT